MARKIKDRTHYAEERRIIRKAMLEKKLVVFVGAGTSIDSGMPNWHDAVVNIAYKLGIYSENIDYMKIPQFYYNARGNKEYVELMRDIFKYNEDLPICDVHRNIVKLNSHTIITTNYDCLIEKAAEENSEFIQVISQDRDLLYRTAEKEIIKMHGDFENGNFVLKEDDYLHYSKNFKLIEAYVKSLIATNVILFVGYSFSDPDVKQIFSWVKDILEEDFQRAYMLEVRRQFDSHEHEYYKNLGINIIYASEMYKNFDKNKASYYTNDFLEYILEEDRNENDIDDIYVRSRAYASLNYVCKNYLDRIFNKYKIMTDGDGLRAIETENNDINELLSKIFEPKDGMMTPKTKLIKSIVEKSPIKTVEIYKKKTKKGLQKKSVLVVGEGDSKIVKAIEDFDFEKLRNIREENEAYLTDMMPELYLEQAYISYVLFEYAKAYRYLRICSQLFYKKKQFVWYFISEVNRYNLGRIIQQDVWGQYNDAEVEKIRNEVASLDLEVVYDKIPIKEMGEKDFLQDLYTFRTYYKLFQNAYLTSKKTEKEAKTKYSIYSGIPGYAKLRTQIKDCYCYDLYNYIMVDRYREDIEIYRLFSKTIINSACSADLTLDGLQQNKIFDTGNIYAETLEKFDVYIIIRYMESDELKSLLKENCNQYINISEEARNYLQNAIPNISKIDNFTAQYFSVYLVLAGYIQLDKVMVKATLEALLHRFSDYFIRTKYNEIIRFLWWANKQKMYDFDAHGSLLRELIKKLSVDILKTDMKYYYQELLTECLAIYKDMSTPYDSEEMNALAVSCEYDILARIYPFVNDNVKESIKRTFDNWKWKGDNTQFKTYESMVINGIFDCKEEVEKNILINLEDIKKNSEGVKPNAYEQIIGMLTNLYLNDKIAMKKEVFDAISRSGIAIYEWLIDVNNYDYELFNVSWLNVCTNKLLETIAAVPNVREGISRKVKEAYTSNSIDKDILKRYFEYFV